LSADKLLGTDAANQLIAAHGHPPAHIPHPVRFGRETR
jgi:hypothetical protein